jgi:hypothetical protein
MQPKKPTCLAIFVPQAWQGDYAIEVDPGFTPFDVTDQIEAMGHPKALELKDNSNASDNLAHGKNAPDWIKTWGGPFYVLIEDALEEYLEAEKAFQAAAPRHKPEADEFSI